MSEIQPTDRTRVRLHSERGVFDREKIYAILDEALVAHVGIAVDGQPRVIPTAILRIDDHVYIHGSPKNQLLIALERGAPASITVTLVDAIVAGRSGFGMSMDYRSVMIYAKAEKISDAAAKESLVAALIQDILPGHIVRPPKKKEIAATVFLRFPLTEVSAKIRDVGVVDPKDDFELDVWAGIVPLKLVGGVPQDCPSLKTGVATPEYAKHYSRGR